MSPQQTGRRVLITGAAGGIGRSLVAAFTDRGWRVAATDLAEVADAAPGSAEVFRPADLTRVDDVAALAAAVAAELGGLDAVVANAAATTPRAPFAEHTAERTLKVLEVNVAATVGLVQALLPQLDGGGSVVLVSSIGAARAFRRNLGYVASKGAVEAMTRGLAVDLAPAGIRVNAVAPGMVRTAAWAGLPAAEDRRRERLVPLGRAADPTEIAAAVCFLAGPESSYVTGAVLPVDGGLSAQAYAPDAEPGLAGAGDFPMPAAASAATASEG